MWVLAICSCQLWNTEHLGCWRNNCFYDWNCLQQCGNLHLHSSWVWADWWLTENLSSQWGLEWLGSLLPTWVARFHRLLALMDVLYYGDLCPSVVDCGSLTISGTGGISVTLTGTTYNQVATYTCTTVGYELVGSSQRVCQANAYWSGSAPYCQRKTTYASMHLKTLYNTASQRDVHMRNVHYSITQMYSLCMHSIWSVIDCGTPDLPSDATALIVSYTNTTYASIVTYSCQIGYNFFGVTSRTCLETYLWSGNPPHCESKAQK